MAKEKLTMISLSGPRDMVDDAIQRCVINREFHAENAIETMSGIKKLYPIEGPNPYTDALNGAFSVMQKVGLSPDYRDFSGIAFDSATDYFERLTLCMNLINEERDEYLRQVNDDKAIFEQVEHIHGIDINIRDLLTVQFVKLRFGKMLEEDFMECYELSVNRNDVYLVRTGEADEWVYCMYFALPDASDQIDAIFSSMGFERIRIHDYVITLGGTADESAKRLEADRLSAEAKVKELDLVISAIRSDEDQLLARYSCIRFLHDSFEMRSIAGFRHDKFYIVGWIPESEAADYAAECERIPGFNCTIATPHDAAHTPPPVKPPEGFLSRIFSPFVEMYGLPAYTEIDPTMFMALTYILIFGIMFGDIGQGFVLIAVGLFMWRAKGAWMGRVVSCVGVSAILFGCIYGSVFGFEHILPGFKVLEEGNAMAILMVSVALGVGMIIVCMVMNVINGVKQHDFAKIIFSANGVAGILLYGGIACGGALLAATGKNVFTTPYVAVFILLPLFCIFASEPLSKLAEGHHDFMPESIGAFAIEGFFELFETFLSYLSNTVSFLRVGAFAISHAGMMKVVMLLSGEGENIIGVIVGNIIVTGIEAVLVCIQVMRLEFYEMFGRFYSSGGQPFEPRIIDYQKASANIR